MDDLFLILSSPDFFIFNIILFVLLGAASGSFSSAIIHRIREGESWIGGVRSGIERSACPHCHHVLNVRDLIPVISWCLQRGRCRYCQQKISKQYILLEVASIVVFLGILSVLGIGLGALFLLSAFPFILAQMVLFYQSKIISGQLCAIITLIGISCLFLLT